MAKEGRNKLVMLVVFLLGGICVIAVIVTCVAIFREGPRDVLIGGASGRQYDPALQRKASVANVAIDNALRDRPLVVISRPGGTREQTWNIAVGHDYGAHSYRDKTGYLTGFTRDLIFEVCAAVNIDCRLVWDAYQNCWDSEPGTHSNGGEGLLGGWYDACAGWAPTIDRRHVFEFSMSHLQKEKAYFFVKPNTSFNSKDITNKKIVFLDGWASDEKCLARQDYIKGGFLPNDTVTHVNETNDAVDLLKRGQVDALFASFAGVEKYVTSNQIKMVNDKAYDCESDGAAIMTRKDSTFTMYWNEGLMKLRSNGRLQDMCDDANKNHALEGSVSCIR